MQEYDLAVFAILWGTAITFALAAITMVDSGRKKLLASLWAIAAAFLVAAIAWPWIAEKWPALKAATENVTANKIAINLLGTAIFCLLVLDFGLRSRWLVKAGNGQGKGGIKGDENSEIATQLAREVAELQDQLDTISTVHDDTVIASVKLTHEVREKLDKLEKNTANPALISNPQTERDVLLLMHFTVYQSTVLMLDDLLSSAPEGVEYGPLQLGGDFALKNTLSTEFIGLVRRKLDPGSWRRENFENVMRNAEASAEYELEQTPMEQRPTGIDTLALRKWVIAHQQCANAVAFLKHEKKEAEENLRNQRYNLLQRYIEKNKG
jgi:hypothetical protein